MTDYYLSLCLQLSPFCVFIRLYQEIRLIKKKQFLRDSRLRRELILITFSPSLNVYHAN